LILKENSIGRDLYYLVIVTRLHFKDLVALKQLTFQMVESVLFVSSCQVFPIPPSDLTSKELALKFDPGSTNLKSSEHNPNGSAWHLPLN